MIRWNQFLDASRRKDKAMARLCKSGDWRDLKKPQAAAFVAFLVEYGSRQAWRPMIRVVLTELNKIHGEIEPPPPPNNEELKDVTPQP